MPSLGTPPEKISSNGTLDFEKSVRGHSNFQNAGLASPVVDTINNKTPALIAAAVYAGHRYARELDAPPRDFARVPHDRVFDESP